MIQNIVRHMEEWGKIKPVNNMFFKRLLSVQFSVFRQVILNDEILFTIFTFIVVMPVSVYYHCPHVRKKNFI